MNRQSVLIAESADSFRNSLAKYLQNSLEIFTCKNGAEALEIVQAEHPDAIILDMMMTELDGVSLLHHIIQDSYHPAILATTRLMSDYIIKNTVKFKVDYLVCKPCGAEALAQRLLEMLVPDETEPVPADPDTMIREMLLRLKISQKHKGFDYLLLAVRMAYEKPNIAITKELYPMIANQFGATGYQIERSIRSAVSAAWDHGGAEVWQSLFYPGQDGIIDRPSNGSFIYTVAADLLRRCPPQKAKDET